MLQGGVGCTTSKADKVVHPAVALLSAICEI